MFSFSSLLSHRRKALSREVAKEFIIPLPHPERPEDATRTRVLWIAGGKFTVRESKRACVLSAQWSHLGGTELLGWSLPSLSFPAVSGTLPKADPEASLRRRGVQISAVFVCASSGKMVWEAVPAHLGTPPAGERRVLQAARGGACAVAPPGALCRPKAGTAGGAGWRMRGGAPGRSLLPPAGKKRVMQAARGGACAVAPPAPSAASCRRKSGTAGGADMRMRVGAPGALCRPLPEKIGYCRRRWSAHARWRPHAPSAAPCRPKGGTAGGSAPRMRGGAPGRPLPPPAGEKWALQAALVRACAVAPLGALCRPLPEKIGYCRRR
ncbi:uncharacterized protein LOC121068194 [Cygnus olor]|uniref:uncharacterized protein LOC121068194 n=1 Tax=Cygnus olor TaxID=8869 RepID=UPI001ADE7CCE|nr:uncharacterized protein LOC121068194 [Cygnus olor]